MIRYLVPLTIFLIVFLSVTDSAYALSKKCEFAEKMYLQGDYIAAAYECERLLHEYKVGEFRNEVSYLAGLSYLKMNKFSEAKEHFESVLYNSNDPFLINEAQIGLAYISEESSPVEEPQFFSIQMGSFKDKKNAERLYNRFKRRKYTVRITKEETSNVIIYKVKIGKFKSREDATRFAVKLRKSGYQTAIVAY